MDALTATNTTGQNPPVVVNDPDETDSVAALTSDFETFLQLLTTQLKNQDPSKPLDSTEFVGQLASFSAVEQQIGTNEKLQTLIDAVTLGSASSLADWIGKEVRSEAAAFFKETPLDVRYDVPKEADAARMIVRNGDGTEVANLSLDTTKSSMTWYGIDGEGNPLPEGLYSFEVENLVEGVATGRSNAETFSEVVETRIEDDGMMLVFADGSKMPVADVEAVRKPDPV